MIGSELYFSLFVGVILSLILLRNSGSTRQDLLFLVISFNFDQPIMLLSVLIISCLTFFIVNNGISNG